MTEASLGLARLAAQDDRVLDVPEKLPSDEARCPGHQRSHAAFLPTSTSPLDAGGFRY